MLFNGTLCSASPTLPTHSSMQTLLLDLGRAWMLYHQTLPLVISPLLEVSFLSEEGQISMKPNSDFKLFSLACTLFLLVPKPFAPE